MIHIAQGWQLAVERGPGWLFRTVLTTIFQGDDGLSQSDDELSGCTESVWLRRERRSGDIVGDLLNELAETENWAWPSEVVALARAKLTRRVVLELDQVGCLTSRPRSASWSSLQDRILAEGGVIRICRTFFGK